MNIFAAAADYASWITLLGVKPGDAPMPGYFNQNTFYLGAQPGELKIPVTGNKVNEKDTKSLIRKLPNTKTGDDLPNPKLGRIEISLEA